MTTTPDRGPKFPDNPRSDQVFFLDVPNGSDPPRGFYSFMTSVGTPTAAGTWTPVDRTAGDQGDLVRPVTEIRQGPPLR